MLQHVFGQQKEERERQSEARSGLVLSERDQKFLQELVAGVRSWLEGNAEPTLALPPVNSYLRMLQYRELEKFEFEEDGHRGFYVQRVRALGRPWVGAALIFLFFPADSLAFFDNYDFNLYL